jgi:hypothetical protein
MQDRSVSSGQGCAVSCQAVEEAKGQRELCNLGFAGVVEAWRLDEVCDGLRAVIVFRRLDGEPRVAVEGHLSAWEVAGETVQ